jgi:hypothetical protein
MARSISCSQARRLAGLRGRNTMPTPYWPGRRQLHALLRHLLAEEASGICSRMPAPSPASGSRRGAAVASGSQDREPLLDDGVALRPLMWATNPTPQASCSLAGSYNPCGRQIVVWFTANLFELLLASSRRHSCRGRSDGGGGGNASCAAPGPGKHGSETGRFYLVTRGGSLLQPKAEAGAKLRGARVRDSSIAKRRRCSRMA